MTSNLTREHATDTEIQMLIDSHEKGTAMFMRTDAYYFMAKELQERRKADSEPVGYFGRFDPDDEDLIDQCSKNVKGAFPLYLHAQLAPECQHQWKFGGANKLQSQKQCIKCGRVELDAQPAPVVADDLSIFEAAIEECKTCDSIDEHAWNHGVLAVMAKYEACRAAMLHTGNSPAHFRCRPAQSSLSPAQGGNSPAIPGGYVMVPKEMTDEIGEAIAMQANCCGGIALDIYDAMLAAAPQEVK